MVRVPLVPPGVPANLRHFGFAGGQDKNFPVYHLVDTSPHNLLRNSRFESWSQGTPGRPDAWGTNAVGAYSKSSTRYWGEFGLCITKNPADGGVSRIQQSIIENPTSPQHRRQPFTMRFLYNGDASIGNDKIRAFFYDGSAYFYSDYYTADDAWHDLWWSFVPDPAATDLVVGFEVADCSGLVGDHHVYIDAVALYWGTVPYRHAEHHNDRSVICQDWLDDEVHKELRGCVRMIPWQLIGTLTGGATSENVYVYLTYPCRQILTTLINVKALGVPKYNMAVTATAYSTTATRITFNYTAVIVAGTTYTLDGICVCVDWSTNADQWK